MEKITKQQPILTFKQYAIILFILALFLCFICFQFIKLYSTWIHVTWIILKPYEWHTTCGGRFHDRYPCIKYYDRVLINWIPKELLGMIHKKVDYDWTCVSVEDITKPNPLWDNIVKQTQIKYTLNICKEVILYPEWTLDTMWTLWNTWDNVSIIVNKNLLKEWFIRSSLGIWTPKEIRYYILLWWILCILSFFGSIVFFVKSNIKTWLKLDWKYETLKTDSWTDWVNTLASK